MSRRLCKTHGEIAQIVRHRCALSGAVEAQTRNREVFIDNNTTREFAQRVTLCSRGQSIQSFRHWHICVERIVARSHHFLRIRIVDRCGELHLFWKQFSGIYVCGDGELRKVVISTLTNRFFQSTKAIGFDVSAQIDSCQIRELNVELALCSPSPLIREILQAQFVCPYFHTAWSA